MVFNFHKNSWNNFILMVLDLNECDEQKRTDLAREDANVNYSSGLCDTPEKYPACCPHRQCDYKFESVTCLNSHLIFDHSTDKNAVSLNFFCK
jgi:ethanolamine utilization cobalamin adenosyltransferase